jgi:hypothetical protein
MRRLMISLLATAALVLCGPAFSVAQASPLASSIGIPSQHYSPIENIGCRHAGDTCPYGKRIVRHSGRGTTCEPCESKEDDSSEKKGKSSSQKEESSDGGHPSGSSPYDEGRGDYDRQDEGYAHGDRGYDRRREGYDRDEGYDRRDEGYAHGYQGRDGGYDDRDEGSSRGDDGYDRQGYGRGSGGYDRGDEGYRDRRYGPARERDYGEGPPPGWRSYNERPYGWQERDCLQFGQEWYCRQ